MSESQAVMSAITGALKRDKVEKGLYPEDIYLVSYLARAARVFKERDLESFYRDLWGMNIKGLVLNNTDPLKIIFTYSVNLAKLKEDLKDIMGKTDTFYLRCVGAEIVWYLGKIEASLDNDDMEDGKEYIVEFEEPETLKCIWRR